MLRSQSRSMIFGASEGTTCIGFLAQHILEKSILLTQWPNFKLLTITYLAGKLKFKLLCHGSLAAE